jgi:hypothetical protein
MLTIYYRIIEKTVIDPTTISESTILYKKIKTILKPYMENMSIILALV